MPVTDNGSYRRATPDQARVVVVMPKEETEKIDNWAIPAGMASRSAAIRLLLKTGLETLTAHRAESRD
jgi:metal-responsive CopG/Arc/MetJ family transcriptional regulator